MQDPTSQSQKSATAIKEEAVLEFWKTQDIFKKTLAKPAPKGEFVFFEGPPTANAKPALHHLEARAFKDVIPRYKTMQGYHVPRRAGWDTHGLPVELQIEKKLGLTSKKEIEEYGIAQFNTQCKESVFEHIHEWERFTDRMGYWVDKEHAYYTFNTPYIESLWNIMSTVEKQGLLYKDYKVLPWCARCGTALSSHELAQGYQDDKDLSVYAKFKLNGEEHTYVVAWTTTPWTLPGNVALAVGADITYVYIQKENETLILAKERLSLVEGEYSIQKEVKGLDLVGRTYEPLYPYLKTEYEKKGGDTTKAFAVHEASFVTTTDGTGVVHIAPMYGADDFELGTKASLPKFHTVTVEGKFIEGCGFLTGRFVKDEDVAIDIIKDLAHRGLLFKKEKYEHSYPHCWRCKTALIYYARDSWYIGMSTLRDTLVAENSSINWEPSHIKEGRFGEWLREIKDWAISRERYWGTPLPIWSTESGERVVVDSVATLRKLTKKSGNTYFVMRHGQTQGNIEQLWCSDVETPETLTSHGVDQVTSSAQKLKAQNVVVDMIIASPFPRAQETARITAEILGIAPEHIITDTRIGEWQAGAQYERKPLDQYFIDRAKSGTPYTFKSVDGESYTEVMTRSATFLYDIDATYAGKTILVISHGAINRSLELLAEGFSYNTLSARTHTYRDFDNAEIRAIDFVPLPHNDLFELDLHKPYIDTVLLETPAGEKLTRTKEVMDVWFDSGAMPFAQNHYPFENKEYVDSAQGYPADFISEAIDQTRGWFYTLHAIGVLMGKGKAYKNVICLGHLLDKEGKKMSKSIGNIVEPFEQMDKFGVDAVRFWMYSVNQPGESKNYDEKSIVEINNKVFNLLGNVLSFYELYRDTSLEASVISSENILDRWVMSRLHQLTSEMTENMDQYNLFHAARSVRDFIDDMSTWYLRRSRDRIKDGDAHAKQTLYVVLKTLAQLIAPFAPFAAEDVWQKLKAASDSESVHLSEWPQAGNIDQAVLVAMKEVRELCTVGNALRKKVGIPVRQPLAALNVKALKISPEYFGLITDELNVKEILEDTTLDEDVALDTEITESLKIEGDYRELVRAVQDLRKAKGLTPSDSIALTLSVEVEPLLAQFMDDFKKTVTAQSVVIENNEGTQVKVGEHIVTISIAG